jgi:hypothetical protein
MVVHAFFSSQKASDPLQIQIAGTVWQANDGREFSVFPLNRRWFHCQLAGAGKPGKRMADSNPQVYSLLLSMIHDWMTP